ncbi:hypothetical protein PPIS_a3551 [Pseudoalteromonas piscicida]|uniref:Uncharacterized protein n=1 Tax=Pseudoalteromonas piscicida TaxID=43662 RepID=A0ABM6NHJ0_PSEO7|nr:hypothetical protein PPIS_a3551 [Pseudoalteromonas piscicida]
MSSDLFLNEQKSNITTKLKHIAYFFNILLLVTFFQRSFASDNGDRDAKH